MKLIVDSPKGEQFTANKVLRGELNRRLLKAKVLLQRSLARLPTQHTYNSTALCCSFLTILYRAFNADFE